MLSSFKNVGSTRVEVREQAEIKSANAIECFQRDVSNCESNGVGPFVNEDMNL
jgi:hypothetical protein